MKSSYEGGELEGHGEIGGVRGGKDEWRIVPSPKLTSKSISIGVDLSHPHTWKNALFSPDYDNSIYIHVKLPPPL